MSKVTLDIDKKNLDTVLNILNNLKSGLINDISIDGNVVTSRKQAVEKPIPSASSKYISRSQYRDRIKKVNHK